MAVISFFTTQQGVLLLGLAAAAVVLLWDWRVALAALLLIQVGVAVLLVAVEGVAGQTMVVQAVVIGLCVLMLATSGFQVHVGRTGRQSGGWFFRLLVLLLMVIALESLDLTLVLPGFSTAIARVFGWIGVVAILMLSLGDQPIFTSIALLIWCVLAQAVAAVYVPAPEITVAMGVVELTLGLAASYLVVAEGLPHVQRGRFGVYGAPPEGGIHIPAPADATPVVLGAYGAESSAAIEARFDAELPSAALADAGPKKAARA